MVCGNAFAKTICSICYEDLKPIVEDLQSISICGHVFHELCIQQWFEYCKDARKKSCPVCKQNCSEANAGRLYFQSVGDQSLSQKPPDTQENRVELRWEVEKLEGKVSGLNSAVEHYRKEVQELSEELCVSKEHAKKETMLKNEALGQKASMQRLLHVKSADLERSTAECKKLQERNMALAKELAALKLASDMNMGEEEVLKLASLGNESNTKDTIDVLKKTLLIRNKSYKELMAKCNVLGRGEARSLRKLEKAKEKIKKLKVRIRELETSIEVKDNEALRALKNSGKNQSHGDRTSASEWNFISSPARKRASHDLEKSFGYNIVLDQNGKTNVDLSCSHKSKKVKPSKDDTGPIALGKWHNSCFLVDEDETEQYTDEPEMSLPKQNLKVSEELGAQKSYPPKPTIASEMRNEACIPSKNDSTSNRKTGVQGDSVQSPFSVIDDDDVVILDDIKQVNLQPPVVVENETPRPVPAFQPGDICFTGGLLGPDGTRRHLGKWCKRAQDRGSGVSPVGMQGSGSSSGNLIAVGADGKGGKIKILRSLNEAALDRREALTPAKQCKSGGTKTNSLQSQGCFQIEHFFGRANR